MAGGATWEQRTAFWKSRDDEYTMMQKRAALDAEWSGRNPYLEPGRPYNGPGQRTQYVLSSTSAEEFNARITALENALKVFDEINKELVAQVIQLQSENKENFDAWLQKTLHTNTD